MQTQAQTPARPLAHRFDRIAEGVYAAIPNGTVNVVSNSTIIINDNDVVIVDAHATPAAARALIEDVKTLTPKPISYLIDTHYHWDHAHGNQAFIPIGAQIIGHEYVRQMLLTNTLVSRSYRSFVDPVPGQIENIRKQLAAEADPAKKTATIEQRLAVQVAYNDALKEITPTPPTMTYETRMSMFRGSREIQLLFLGRGHTGGDTVVYLPKEKIVATGDLVVGSLPFMYMGDGFVNEWPDTMEKILQLDFDTIIPGHGDPFKDKEAHPQISELPARPVEAGRRSQEAGRDVGGSGEEGRPDVAQGRLPQSHGARRRPARDAADVRRDGRTDGAAVARA